MKSKVNQLEAYSQAFRDLVNAKVLPCETSIREVLRLSKDEDWSFLCVSMDVIGDSCAAIESFLQFGLDGPTKYDDVGEKYLRLYGVLSATYIQQEAMLKLFQLLNVPPSLKEGRQQVDTLAIRSLRHKLGSHSTSYLDKDTNSVQSYVPIRLGLEGFNCNYGMGGRGDQESIDLQVALNEHLSLMIELIDRILEKALGTFFKGQKTCSTCVDFNSKLSDLRIEKEGGIVMQIPDGKKIIITIASD